MKKDWSQPFLHNPCEQNRVTDICRSDKLIQVAQRCFIIVVERTVLVGTDTGQHPGIRIRSGWCARNIDSAYGAGALVVITSSAAIRTVHIICVTEADAVNDFVCQNIG